MPARRLWCSEPKSDAMPGFLATTTFQGGGSPGASSGRLAWHGLGAVLAPAEGKNKNRKQCRLEAQKNRKNEKIKNHSPAAPGTIFLSAFSMNTDEK